MCILSYFYTKVWTCIVFDMICRNYFYNLLVAVKHDHGHTLLIRCSFCGICANYTHVHYKQSLTIAQKHKRFFKSNIIMLVPS